MARYLSDRPEFQKAIELEVLSCLKEKNDFNQSKTKFEDIFEDKSSIPKRKT